MWITNPLIKERKKEKYFKYQIIIITSVKKSTQINWRHEQGQP
jgi:hypothetical protein